MWVVERHLFFLSSRCTCTITTLSLVVMCLFSIESHFFLLCEDPLRSTVPYRFLTVLNSPFSKLCCICFGDRYLMSNTTGHVRWLLQCSIQIRGEYLHCFESFSVLDSTELMGNPGCCGVWTDAASGWYTLSTPFPVNLRGAEAAEAWWCLGLLPPPGLAHLRPLELGPEDLAHSMLAGNPNTQSWMP